MLVTKRYRQGDSTIKLLLIPGMDGTGELFSPLLDVLPENIDTQVVCLNTLNTQEPKEQALEISLLLSNEEIIIISESYSGYIAYQLSLLSNLNIKHVIFAASFLSNPSKLTRFNKLFPFNLIRSGSVPSFILSFVLFAQRNNKKMVKLFLSSIKLVSNSTLRQRLNIIENLIQPTEYLSIPCTYVQASNDYLVNKKSVDVFKKLCLNINVLKTSGGHFIIQSNPKYFSKLVRDIIAL